MASSSTTQSLQPRKAIILWFGQTGQGSFGAAIDGGTRAGAWVTNSQSGRPHAAIVVGRYAACAPYNVRLWPHCVSETVLRTARCNRSVSPFVVVAQRPTAASFGCGRLGKTRPYSVPCPCLRCQAEALRAAVDESTGLRGARWPVSQFRLRSLQGFLVTKGGCGLLQPDQR